MNKNHNHLSSIKKYPIDSFSQICFSNLNFLFYKITANLKIFYLALIVYMFHSHIEVYSIKLYLNKNSNVTTSKNFDSEKKTFEWHHLLFL